MRVLKTEAELKPNILIDDLLLITWGCTLRREVKLQIKMRGKQQLEQLK